MPLTFCSPSARLWFQVILDTQGPNFPKTYDTGKMNFVYLRDPSHPLWIFDMSSQECGWSRSCQKAAISGSRICQDGHRILYPSFITELGKIVWEVFISSPAQVFIHSVLKMTKSIEYLDSIANWFKKMVWLIFSVLHIFCQTQHG
jgi:hypothetical protein